MSSIRNLQLKQSATESPGLLRQIEGPVRRVAVFRASRLGDFVCATPAFRVIRSGLPDARITLVALPFVENLAARLGDLDDFVAFPGYPGIAEQFFDPATASRFFLEMQNRGFDLTLQLHGSGLYSNPVALMFGARYTAGFVRPGDPPGRLDAAMPYPTGRHEVRKLLDFVEFLGFPPGDSRTSFPLTDEELQEADTMLAGLARPLIGLHAGARESTKRWSPDRFAEASNRLGREFGGTVVLLGTAEDKAIFDQILSVLRIPACNLSGRTSLGLLGAVVDRLDVLLTNDSGPAHVAYARQTPSVTVFGGTSPNEWAGPDLEVHPALAHPVDCRPCDFGDCPVGNLCLNGVTVEAVVAAAGTLLRCRAGDRRRLS